MHRWFVLFHREKLGFSAKSCHKGSRSRICVWNNKNHESELSQGVTSWTSRFYVWNNSIFKIITENNTNEWDFENRGVRAFSTTTKTVIKIMIILTPHACLILRCCETELTEVRPQHGWGCHAPSLAGGMVQAGGISGLDSNSVTFSASVQMIQIPNNSTE